MMRYFSGDEQTELMQDDLWYGERAEQRAAGKPATQREDLIIYG